MTTYKYIVLSADPANGPLGQGGRVGVATELLGTPHFTRLHEVDVEAYSPAEALAAVRRQLDGICTPSEGLEGLFEAQTAHTPSPVNIPRGLPNAKVLALLNAMPGREAEFEAWHTDVHFADVTSMAGWTAAQRFENVASQVQPLGLSPVPWRYLVLYDLETDNVPEAVDFAFSRLGTHEISTSEAADSGDMLVAAYSTGGDEAGVAGNHRDEAGVR